MDSRTAQTTLNHGVSSPRTRLCPRPRAPGYEPAVLEALDDEDAPVLAVRLADDMRGVVLVDHLGGRLAVLVEHPVDAVADVAQVQPALVRLAAARALELDAAADAEDELARAPAVALNLPATRSVIRRLVLSTGPRT